MNRIISILTVLLFGSSLIGAEPVSINGIVKKTGGTAGIAGVKVSLINVSNLSTTTGADGTFNLTGNTTATISRNVSDEPIRFMIKGNTITLAPTSKKIHGSITIFSSLGKVLSFIRFPDLSAGKQSIPIPRFSSGVSIMRVTVGEKSFTRTLVCVGNTPAIKNESVNGGSDKLILAKQLTSTAVDTLMAEKEGYTVKKIAIEKYIQDNMTVTLDTNSGGNTGECTRDALKEIADKYLAAQKEGDPSTLSLASEVSYIQNNKTISADQCMWNTAMPVDFSLSFFDVDSCRAFVEVVSSTGGTPWVMMTWLKVDDGKISEVDAMVTTTGDFMFNAEKYLMYAKEQDWSVLTENQQVPRQEVIDGADAYLDMFSDGVDNVPWGNPCERIEGGNMHVTPDCIQGMPGHGGMGGTVDITKRRYAVDVDMGTVDIFCSFGGSMPDSHMFRLIDGKIRLVHTLTIQ